MNMLENYHACKSISRVGGLFIAVLLVIAAVLAAPAQAQVLQRTDVPINGEIERLTLGLPGDPGDNYPGGIMVVAGYRVILPRNLLIDLPANRLSLLQIFEQAPAGCVLAGESGLAKTDTCNASGAGGFATISAVRTAAGDIIAGDVFIQKGIELVSGTVTYINYDEGYFRMNGATGSATTGIMVRLNDPGELPGDPGRHTIQTGAGCLPGSRNCSPDPRFTLDPDNYVTTFSTGYPFCIPSTVQRNFVDIISLGTTTAKANADGTGDVLCPSTNRSTPADGLETAADSRRFAPLRVGDPVTAEGNFETINGVRFLSSHTTQLKKSLWTKNEAGQPDYLFLEEVFINTPGFENQRIRSLFIGFTSMGPTAPDFGRGGRTDVDIWSIHRDPVNNAIHEFPLASVLGCDNTGGQGTCGGMGLINAGLNIFRIRHDVDFIQARLGGVDAKLSPCAHIQANPRWGTSVCPSSTLENNFAILSPAPHEIIARTGRKLDSPAGSLISIDISGAETTNGEYLFPLGLNLGGIEGAEFNEIDLNQMAKPVIFEGIPWNLDRRLSPSGCLNFNGVCEALGASPMGTFRLDPFPFTGLAANPGVSGFDPGLQAEFSVVIPGLGTLPGGTPKGSFNVAAFNNTANPLTPAYDRIRSFVTDLGGGSFNFDGNNTVVPYPTTLANDPPDQGIISTPTPTFTLAVSPVGFAASARAQNDTAVTRTGVPVSIPVLFNDAALVGLINAASVTIVSPASHGTAVANSDGTVSYTPGPGFIGADTFTYTFAELTSGEVSNIATVSVAVNSRASGSFTGAPVSMNDVLKALRIAAGLVTPTADDLVNGDIAPLGAPDGQINTADALLILKRAVGLVSF